MNNDLNKKIELYFFDSSSPPEEYQNFYIDHFSQNITDFNNYVCRFSPLYQVLRDIKYSFGHLKGLPTKFDYPYKAGIILINIVLHIIAKDIYGIKLGKGEKTKKFIHDFMGLDYGSAEGLRFLRNALEHRGYTLFYEDTRTIEIGTVKHKEKIKCNFLFTLDQNVVLQVNCDQDGTRHYRIQPRKLFTLLFKSVKNLKNDLLSGGREREISIFKKSFNPERWVGRPTSLNFKVDLKKS